MDPGHGGANYLGAVHRGPDGKADLIEKDVNLKVGLRLASLLREEGHRAVLTRDGDYSLTPFEGDLVEWVKREQQARADLCNDASTDLLVSVHFNGFDDPAVAGAEVYYCPDRPFADKSLKLARFVLDSLVEAIRTAGYSVPVRGLKDDRAIGQRFGYPHSFLLGANPDFRPSQMPGIFGEPLFVTNDREAAFLKEEKNLEAIARGYLEGIRRYLDS